MERLTYRNQDVSHVEKFLNRHSNFDGTKIANSLKRLAEYENIGLTPSQLIEIDKQVTELCKELGEYKKAEKDGLLIKLPCKVGDTVYQLMVIPSKCKNRKIYYEITEARLIKFVIDSFFLCFWTETLDNNKSRNEMTINAFGETVFLTREAAENALAEMEGIYEGN